MMALPVLALLASLSSSSSPTSPLSSPLDSGGEAVAVGALGGVGAPAASCRREPTVRMALVASGITPATLAAAGVEPNQAAAVMSMAQITTLASGQSLEAAMVAAESAAGECARLEDLALRGLATPEQAAALAGAKANRAAAREQREDAIAAFFSAATQGLNEDQRTALQRIGINRRTALPLEYRVLHLGANEAGELRQLLAAERIAADRGEAAEVTLNITLGEQERAELAAADSAMNLGAIDAVWAGALGE